MKAGTQCRGMTLIGFLFVLILVVIVVILGMKIVPIYAEYYDVVSSMEGLQAEPNMAQKSTSEIRDLLFRRLYVNYVSNVKQGDVHVVRRGGVQVHVAYQVRKHLVANMDVIASFDKTVELR